MPSLVFVIFFFSLCPMPLFFFFQQLRRGESLVRCVALHLVQQLPQILESLPESRRAPVEQFLFDFASALINHPSMQSERGGMLGEGNNGQSRGGTRWRRIVLFSSILLPHSVGRVLFVFFSPFFFADFVNKAYLWQTMCVLVPSVRVAGSPSRRAQLHDLLQRHTWQWFERPLTSVAFSISWMHAWAKESA